MSNIRLHYFPPMCSVAAMSALAMTGAPYEAVFEDMFSDRAALRAISPMGRIPVLEADGLVVTDTIAIIFWLSQRFPEAKLLPSDSDGLALALAQLAWFGSQFHIVRRRYTRPQYFCEDVDAQPKVRALAEPVYWAELERVNQWISGNALKGPGVEAYALLFYHWATMDGFPVQKLESYTELARSMRARPEIARVLELHQSPLIETLA